MPFLNSIPLAQAFLKWYDTVCTSLVIGIYRRTPRGIPSTTFQLHHYSVFEKIFLGGLLICIIMAQLKQLCLRQLGFTKQTQTATNISNGNRAGASTSMNVRIHIRATERDKGGEVAASRRQRFYFSLVKSKG